MADEVTTAVHSGKVALVSTGPFWSLRWLDSQRQPRVSAHLNAGDPVDHAYFYARRAHGRPSGQSVAVRLRRGGNEIESVTLRGDAAPDTDPFEMVVTTSDEQLLRAWAKSRLDADRWSPVTDFVEIA